MGSRASLAENRRLLEQVQQLQRARDSARDRRRVGVRTSAETLGGGERPLVPAARSGRRPRASW